MNKKAQGISINVVIVAAIALLVLVILSVIFMGRMGTFGEKSKDCVAQGGANANCFPSGTDCTATDYKTPYTAWTCPNNGVCCIKAG